jgi:hypothetical protein
MFQTDSSRTDPRPRAIGELFRLSESGPRDTHHAANLRRIGTSLRLFQSNRDLPDRETRLPHWSALRRIGCSAGTHTLTGPASRDEANSAKAADYLVIRDLHLLL